MLLDPYPKRPSGYKIWVCMSESLQFGFNKARQRGKNQHYEIRDRQNTRQMVQARQMKNSIIIKHDQNRANAWQSVNESKGPFKMCVYYVIAKAALQHALQEVRMGGSVLHL